MKTINVDGITVECTEEGKRYACYIVEHDMYFSTKIGDDEMVIRKTRAMIQAEKNFLIEFPQYKLGNIEKI